ncbi:MAG: hypothetical protein WAK17_28075 [Candidatus Nitrosopolaris sp.]|jgi:hypothetical protein
MPFHHDDGILKNRVLGNARDTKNDNVKIHSELIHLVVMTAGLVVMT